MRATKAQTVIAFCGSSLRELRKGSPLAEFEIPKDSEVEYSNMSSWDPDDLRDMDDVSEVQGSVVHGTSDQSLPIQEEEPDVFGSVANNTQEFQEHSPLHNSARSTSSEEEQVLQQDGQIPFTEFPFKAVLREGTLTVFLFAF